MPALDPFERLEAARDLLDAGRPDRASDALAAAFPAELAGESLFLRAEALRAQGYFSRAAAGYRAALAALGREERDLVVGAQLGLARCARSLGAIPAARRAMGRARAAAGRAGGELAGTLALEDAL